MKRVCGHTQHGTYWTDGQGTRVHRDSDRAKVLHCAWCGAPFEKVTR